MSIRDKICVVLVLCSPGIGVATLLASSASAADTAPSGVSAVDQYLESIPTGTGNRPTERPGSGGDGVGSGAVGASTGTQGLAKLAVRGKTGQQAASVLDSTRPPALPAASGSADGGSPLSVVAPPALNGGSGGLGALLPGALVAIGLGGILAAVIRRRQRGTDTEPPASG